MNRRIGLRTARGGIPLALFSLLYLNVGCGEEEPAGESQCEDGLCGPSTGRPQGEANGPDAGGMTPPTMVPTTPVADGGATPKGSGMPCDVEAVVHAYCGSCHSDPPVGTFMPLMTQAHFQEASTSDPSRPYHALAFERVNAADSPMPPVTEPQPSEEELATLTAWLEAGAPASDQVCAGSDGDGGMDMPDDGRELDTSGLECHQFLAHADMDKSEKFHVGVANDAYYNMIFDPPWDETVYGIVVKPIIDNAQVLHHWLLYREPGAGVDGAVEQSGGAHGSGELVHGWAPGGIALDFRKHGDVGFELPPDQYLVEFHYNSADPSAVDASGVEVCFQREKTEHIAGLSWLGKDHGIESYIGGEIFGTAASGTCLAPADEWVGTCDPQSNEEIHMMFVVPHMHEAGTHMKAVIDGPGGSRILHDEPFDFDYQVSFEVNEVLMPGETITTTCSFSEPKCAGQATGAEMCYLYTYAYPKGALTDGRSWGETAHGEGTCLGQDFF